MSLKPILPRGTTNSRFQDNDFRADLVGLDAQSGHRHRKPKPAWASAARIEIQHPMFRGAGRPMGMTGHDDLKASGERVQIEGAKVMEYVQVNAFDFDHLCRGELPGPCAVIHVSTYGEHWPDFLQGLDHVGEANVARMHDEIRVLQRGKGLGTQ